MTETSISGEAVVPGAVGVAVRSMVFGTLVGTALIALALWISRLMLPPGGPTAPVTGGPVFAVIIGGVFAGIGMAVGVAWALMRVIPSAFRRGGLSVLTGFLTMIVMLPTKLLNDLVGPGGILGFAVLCLVGAWFVRPKSTPPSPAR